MELFEYSVFFLAVISLLLFPWLLGCCSDYPTTHPVLPPSVQSHTDSSSRACFHPSASLPLHSPTHSLCFVFLKLTELINKVLQDVLKVRLPLVAEGGRGRGKASIFN